MAQVLALTNAPNQSLSVALNVNGQNITLAIRLYYNRVGGFWAMDLSEAGTLLVASVPLITGDWPGGNILAQYDYMRIGAAFIVNQNGASTDFPTDVNLGNGFVLLWDSN